MNDAGFPECEVSIPGFRGTFTVVPLSSIDCPDVTRNNAITTTVGDDEIGLLQPIAVRKTERGEKPYEIVAGRRRYWSFYDNGYDLIPVIVVKCDRSASDLRVLVENMARDYNVPHDLGSLINLLQEGYTVEGLEGKLGIYKRNFKKLSSLVSLCPRGVKLLKEGGFSVSAARIIAKLPRHLQDAFFDKHVKYTLANAREYRSLYVSKPTQIDLLTGLPASSG